MRAGAGDAFGAAVEVDAGADEVDRYRAAKRARREGLAVDLDGLRGLELAEAELLEQTQQPALAGERRSRGRRLRSRRARLAEGRPGAGEAAPRRLIASLRRSPAAR